MFFQNRKPKIAPRTSPYAEYVVAKIAPYISGRSEVVLHRADESFLDYSDQKRAELDLIEYGHATSQFLALAFGTALRDVKGQEISDIEYGDCALAAMFIIRSQIRPFGSSTVDTWFDLFTRDIGYLVFASDDEINDLKNLGNDHFLYYEQHPDAKLPVAYIHILAKTIKLRENGETEPYKFSDPMQGPNLVVELAMAETLEKMKPIVWDWARTVLEVRDLGDEGGFEVLQS